MFLYLLIPSKLASLFNGLYGNYVSVSPLERASFFSASGICDSKRAISPPWSVQYRQMDIELLSLSLSRALSYAKSSLTTDNMEVSGDNFLGAPAIICMFHECMFHKCFSRAALREADSYPRPIYLGNGSDGMIVSSRRVVRRRHATPVALKGPRARDYVLFPKTAENCRSDDSVDDARAGTNAAGSHSNLRDKSGLVENARAEGGEAREIELKRDWTGRRGRINKRIVTAGSRTALFHSAQMSCSARPPGN